MNFACPKNQDVENFLVKKDKGIRLEKSSLSRTYLILNEQGDILAYFSLSFKEIMLYKSDISHSLTKKLMGFKTNKEIIHLKVFLIGQIGKNSLFPQNPIHLSDILAEIYQVISQIQALIGGRVVILECEDNPKLINLYKKAGFALLETADPDPKFKTMYRSILFN